MGVLSAVSQSQVSVAGSLSAQQELNVHNLVDELMNMTNKYGCGYYGNYNYKINIVLNKKFHDSAKHCIYLFLIFFWLTQ